MGARITPETLDFLVENRMRNDRPWFNEHKPRYKALVEGPLLALSEAVIPTLAGIDPMMVLEPRRTLSRIWRDTRFAKDKTLFRDVCWLAFKRGKGMAAPAFFFEMTPSGYRWGCGYYDTPPRVAEQLRAWIVQDNRRWLAARDAFNAIPGCTLMGERYKRPKFTDLPEEKLLWLNQRSFVAGCENLPVAGLFSPGLADELKAGFAALGPVYHFILAAHENL